MSVTNASWECYRFCELSVLSMKRKTLYNGQAMTTRMPLYTVCSLFNHCSSTQMDVAWTLAENCWPVLG